MYFLLAYVEIKKETQNINLLGIQHHLVITLFLPLGFSRVSTRKMRQPGPSQVDPTGVHRIKRTLRQGPEYISQSLGRFDQV
jgi:hypothetical protein